MRVNPDMPWNEEIRAGWARMERLAVSPATVALMLASYSRVERAGGASEQSACRPSSSSTLTTRSSHPRWARMSPTTSQTRNIVELHCLTRAATCITSSNRGGNPSRLSSNSLPATSPTCPTFGCSRTVLFTDIVDSTRRAAEIGDRDWRALLDAHDAIVRSQLARFRGREVNTSGDGFLAMFDGPQRAIRCAMAIRDAVQAARHRGARGLAHRRMRNPRRRHRRHRGAHRRSGERARGTDTTCLVSQHAA